MSQKIKTGLLDAHRKLSDYYYKFNHLPLYTWSACECFKFISVCIAVRTTRPLCASVMCRPPPTRYAMPSIHMLCHPPCVRPQCHLPLSGFTPLVLLFACSYIECFPHCFQCIASLPLEPSVCVTSKSIASHRVKHDNVIAPTSA